MLGPILKYIRQAGAPREQDTDRDGFLSYHAESHAVAVGAGAGFTAAATGETQLLGLVLPAVTSGLRAKEREFSKIIADVRQEPHYALAGLILGAAVGALVRLATGGL